ncbi:MAG: N-acetylmuramoyl-L-alanine amidase, partial [Ruminococcus flavefaciens]|nr:N-acetylmuramoyl-L-alanine amidase [Ruminococcus flavefaciens]
KGLMLHSVGCPQPSAQVFIKNWNSASYDRACVHGFIDGNDGTVYQCLPWDHRGWHGGGSSNNTHIGVEMCEPACIKYTGGATFTCSDKPTAQAVAKRTYEAAVELFAMLCQKFNLDPLGAGVIVSHKEGCKLGIASNHGDPEHLWTQLGMAYTMDTFRAAVKAAMGGTVSTAPAGVSGTKIMGAAVATAEQMTAYIKAKNPQVAQSVLDMIPLYLSEGAAEGVRGDIAFAQSCLETGNFAFSGSAVTLDQNNFCGMGVTANGQKGNSFDTPQFGIRAQVQHLKAYASTEPLKNECIDPRFKYVTRGCAEVVEWLGQQENPQGKGWATGAGYGEKVITILKAILATAGGAASTTASVSFMVRVTATDLNIRTGPGTSYAKTGKFTGAGVFTITEVQDGLGSTKGWGKLKSGAGWISLDYAQKI